MAAEIHVDDVGTIFRVTVTDEDGAALDISAATLKQIVFEKPDETTTTKTASLDTDGTDGIMRYTTVSGDLDQAGRWKIQGVVGLPSGQWHTNVDTFKVKENL